MRELAFKFEKFYPTISEILSEIEKMQQDKESDINNYNSKYINEEEDYYELDASLKGVEYDIILRKYDLKNKELLLKILNKIKSFCKENNCRIFFKNFKFELEKMIINKKNEYYHFYYEATIEKDPSIKYFEQIDSLFYLKYSNIKKNIDPMDVLANKYSEDDLGEF